MTTHKFDIFRGLFGNPDAIWIECVEGLAAATHRMDEIADERPGHYFVFDSGRQTVVASIRTDLNQDSDSNGTKVPARAKTIS